MGKIKTEDELDGYLCDECNSPLSNGKCVMCNEADSFKDTVDELKLNKGLLIVKRFTLGSMGKRDKKKKRGK